MKNKMLFLQNLCNKFGDFKVCTRFKDGNWSKHSSVMYCWDNLDKEKWRLEKATNRQILKCELVLDIDPEKNENVASVKKKFDKICIDLEKNNCVYKAYFTGSRGFHIHLFFYGLLLYDFYDRKKIREFIIEKYKCDLMKSSDNTMIALEGAPHFKTGIPKTLVRFNE